MLCSQNPGCRTFVLIVDYHICLVNTGPSERLSAPSRTVETKTKCNDIGDILPGSS